MSLTQYETVFVLPADNTPQQVDEFIDKLKAVVTNGGGEVTAIDKWGRRRLAYPIKRHREGFYVFLMFKAPGALMAEVTQFFLVNENFIRNIVCKSPEGKPGSPTMNVPAPLMQMATTPYFRTPPTPAGAPASPSAPVDGAVQALKEESHERPVAPAPAQ